MKCLFGVRRHPSSLRFDAAQWLAACRAEAVGGGGSAAATALWMAHNGSGNGDRERATAPNPKRRGASLPAALQKCSAIGCVLECAGKAQRRRRFGWHAAVVEMAIACVRITTCPQEMGTQWQRLCSA